MLSLSSWITSPYKYYLSTRRLHQQQLGTKKFLRVFANLHARIVLWGVPFSRHHAVSSSFGYSLIPLPPTRSSDSQHIIDKWRWSKLTFRMRYWVSWLAGSGGIPSSSSSEVAGNRRERKTLTLCSLWQNEQILTDSERRTSPPLSGLNQQDKFASCCGTVSSSEVLWEPPLLLGSKDVCLCRRRRRHRGDKLP